MPARSARALWAAGAAALALATALGVAPVRRAPVLQMRGVCWEGRGRVGPEALAPLVELHVDWISQTPFGWSRALDDPEVRLASGRHGLWGESDEGLAETARLARAHGIRTLLKPHLWVRGGAWVGELRMRDEADWQAFFRSYETFILHYAALAQRERFEALAVGTELVRSSAREADWRRVIARVRQVYDGPLTYCAAWNEAAQVPFWDALDFVGVQAYYPLRGDPHGDEAALRASWAELARALEALARRVDRPVVLTEVGYKSLAGSLARPWEWDTRGEVDYGLQAAAFRAMFEALARRDWFGGTFVWKWHPGLPARGTSPARYARDFTPQGKPALDVIARAYGRSRPR